MTAYQSGRMGPVGRMAAARIRALRERNGLTREQLAAKLNGALSVEAIRARELRHTSITVDDLVVIAEALGAPVAELLNPESCTTCSGAPPPGFTCQTCGATT
ncbi:helix-turn-helix transcriptional regulator [Nocardiopsis tropica]|uniref:Helix-turn-helix transcriptional regulator n=1 Tax=Nocardiopsis tropica TaxID=109330 RepID=A0ABU7KM16_9ACTN|nr:helix-turn-helix transcriptional regulator [Nocardiopsis umidischolae]MEE2050329.1 helix-turn-helix transcriptional regulator [Nocardiopsis umidischolae]